MFLAWLKWKIHKWKTKHHVYRTKFNRDLTHFECVICGKQFYNDWNF